MMHSKVLKLKPPDAWLPGHSIQKRLSDYSFSEDPTEKTDPMPVVGVLIS